MKRDKIVGEVPENGQDAASRAEDVLLFWFAREPDCGPGAIESRWFFPTREFDRLCRARFLSSYQDAVQGRLDDWKDEPRSCMALVLLLDQFPRNMFRGTARAFATDAKARQLSRRAIALGFDRKLSPLMRMFLHLPFEHSENMDDQFESLRLTGVLAAENPEMTEALRQAQQHLETVRRFGRFPGRNDALGRQSTQEEIDFLKHERPS